MRSVIIISPRNPPPRTSHWNQLYYIMLWYLLCYECSHSDYASALPSELGFLILIYISEFHIHNVVSRRSRLYGLCPVPPLELLTLYPSETLCKYTVRQETSEGDLHPACIKAIVILKPQSHRHRIEPATICLTSKHFPTTPMLPTLDTYISCLTSI